MKSGLKQQKDEMRKKAREIRKNLTPQYRKAAEKVIFDKISRLECYREAKNIMVYVSFGDEMDTHAFIRQMLNQGKQVYTPVCLEKGQMALVLTEQFPGKLKEGTWGILEMPLEGAQTIEAEKLDLIISPGLAFTAKGKRLGYGGGYYDRLFAKIKPECVIVCPTFDEAVFPDLPTGAFDCPGDIIISEKMTSFTGQRQPKMKENNINI